MSRTFTLTYGLVAYASFLAASAYLAGFLGNFGVPKAIDSPPTDPWWLALAVNAALIGVFGVQHSVMARPRFKEWWTRFVPRSIERSTYVLLSSAALGLLFWQWRPLGGVIWDVDHPAGRAALYGLFACGWILILYASFQINHFDLFGLRHVWLHFRGRPYTPLSFKVPSIYRYVRHPLYVGWLTVFWATPTMTIAHLVFAAGLTAYILLAIPLEERDLIAFHGEDYAKYREEVPGLVPFVADRSAVRRFRLSLFREKS